MGQVKDGTSATDQKEKVKHECEHKGYKLIKFYADDAVSGASSERAGLNELIEDARAGMFDLIMFTKLDRFGRNLRDLLNLWHLIEEELELKIYCIEDQAINTEGKFGKVMLGILGTFAEFERELIRERMVQGKGTKMRNGLIFPVAKPPFGYDWNRETKILEKVPEQIEIYKRIVSMYLNEHRTLKDIAITLSDDGIDTPGCAMRWNTSTLSKILRNPAYCGDPVTYNKYKYKEVRGKNYSLPDKEKSKEEWIIHTFPPAITKPKWHAIQQRLESQKLKPKKRHKKYREHFLVKAALGRALVCGECKSTVVQKLRVEGKSTYFYYNCFYKACSEQELKMQGRERCILKKVNAERVDYEVYKRVVQLLSNPVHFGRQYLERADTRELKKQIKKLEKRLTALNKKIEKAYDMITDPDVEKVFEKKLKEDIAEQKRLNAGLELKRDELETKDSGTESLKELEEYIKETKYEILSDRWHAKRRGSKFEKQFKEFLLSLPFETKKRLIEATIAPESGGMVELRFGRDSDLMDPWEVAEWSKEEFHENWKTPLVYEDPIVDLHFMIDVEQLRSVILGLDRKKFYDPSNPCAIPGKGKDAH
jgi:site-specific DNA recombinase